MPTIQADASIGFKKEATFGTPVVTDRFLEFTDESFDTDREFFQGSGMRAGARVARGARRIMQKDGIKGDFTIEVPTRGLGTLLELLFGVASSTLVSAGLYQELFTLIHGDYLPSATFQKGIPRLGANQVDAYTFPGMVCSDFELSVDNSDVLKLKSSWMGRTVSTGIAYATPTYPAASDLFTFIGGSLLTTLNGGAAIVPPTTMALATGGVSLANVRDFSVSVDNKLDDGGYNLGGAGLRTRKPAVNIAEVKGKFSADYDSAFLRDAWLNQTDMGLILNFQTTTAISAGNFPTLQLTIPSLRLEGEVPKANGGDVIGQSIDFTAFDNLVAAEPIYLAVRTADLAL